MINNTTRRYILSIHEKNVSLAIYISSSIWLPVLFFPVFALECAIEVLPSLFSPSTMVEEKETKTFIVAPVF
jgi:hypothetical protein